MKFHRIKDYCTMAPDKLFGYDLSGCCAQHDKDYAEQTKTRLQADRDLLWCINRVAPAFVGYVYFWAVRLVGWIFWSIHKLRKG